MAPSLPKWVRWYRELARRLEVGSGHENLASISKSTEFSAETVRRHMGNGRVTARFIAAFCAGYEIDPTWLLFGRGTMTGRGRRPGAAEVRMLRNPDRWYEGVAERLAIAVGNEDRDQVAKRTKLHPENVRRHLLTGRLSARVLVIFCRAYGAEPRWLLFGQGGPPRRGLEGVR